MEKILLRPVEKTDHSFIYSTYLKNNWFSTKNDTTLKKDTWMRIQHGRVESLLGKGLGKIACLSEDLDTILGYKLEQFVYIRPQWRNVAGIEEMFK